MPGEIVLAGGEEFRSGCEEMDSFILGATGLEHASVLILPTAAVTGPQKAAADGVRHFGSLGADASGLMVLERSHAEDEAVISPVSEAAVVYFTGGDPGHLMATLKESKLLGRLQQELERGAIVGGSSAGAMVMGSLMWRSSAKQWVQGTGIAQGLAVLPHHETGDPAMVVKWLESTGLPKELKVLGIDAQTGCFGTPGKWKVLGSGRVTAYSEGTWSIFSSGENLPKGF